MAEYFESDLGSDIVGSLSLTARLSETLTDNPGDWKWCVIAAHSALQSAMILVLAGSDGAGAYKAQSQKNFRAWLKGEVEGTKYPDVRLAGFEQLYNWAQEPDRSHGVPLKTSEDQDRLVILLDKRRDSLMHHEEVAWIMVTEELVACVLAAMDTVEELLRHPRMLTSVGLDDALSSKHCFKLIDSIRGSVKKQIASQ
jgi:hypothetical protein